MCRSIRVLRKQDGVSATSEEIRAAALQFVRKISGCRTPSRANEDAFAAAVSGIAGLSADLLRSLESSRRRLAKPSHNRDQPCGPEPANT